MKRTILFLLTAFSICSVAHAQTDSSFLKIGRVYAGVITNGFLNQGAGFSNQSVLMVGSEAELVIDPTLSFKARTAYVSTGPVTHLFLVGKSELGDILLGFMPRSVPLLLRPNPVSAEGQAEYLTTRTIPGAEKGIMFRRGGLNFGIFNSGGNGPEYNIGLEDSLFGTDFCLAAFANGNRVGLGYSVTTESSSLIVFCYKSTIAVHLQFCPSASSGTFYGDAISADLNFQKAESWEIGWRKEYIPEFQGHRLPVTVGCGIGRIGQNIFQVYVLMHI